MHDRETLLECFEIVTSVAANIYKQDSPVILLITSNDDLIYQK